MSVLSDLAGIKNDIIIINNNNFRQNTRHLYVGGEI
jgi:hypothetical protein